MKYVIPPFGGPLSHEDELKYAKLYSNTLRGQWQQLGDKLLMLRELSKEEIKKDISQFRKWISFLRPKDE